MVHEKTGCYIYTDSPCAWYDMLPIQMSLDLQVVSGIMGYKKVRGRKLKLFDRQLQIYDSKLLINGINNFYFEFSYCICR